MTARVDPRTGWVLALCALDNLVKGASGQAIQCANVALGLPETTGLPLGRALPVSVTAPQGFVAAGGSAGIKAGGVPDVAVVATADGRAVPAAGVFTSNLATAAPVQVSRAHLAASGGHAAGVILTSGNANAATGQPGRDAATASVRVGGRGHRCRAERDPGLPDRADRHPLPPEPRRCRSSAGIVGGRRRRAEPAPRRPGPS